MSNIAMSAWDLAEEDYLEPPESPEYDPPRWKGRSAGRREQ